MKKKIIILGGSFNPIHNGHLAIADAAYHQLEANEVWFLPLKSPRWKEVSTSQSDRLEMIKRAIATYPNYKLCDYELKHTIKGEPTYTFNTIKAFKKLYPEYEFYFLIGSDQLELLANWYQIEELAKMVTFVLAKRPGYQINQQNIKKYGVKVLDIQGPMVSSSSIRIFDSYAVPQEVAEYMQKRGLYLENKLILELSTTRFEHSKRVAVVAKKIAKANKYDVDQAYIAAILHDCAKEIPSTVAKKLMEAYFPKYLDIPPQIYHQFLGTIVAQDTYHIKDPVILQAMMYHTTGHYPMSDLDKIVYAADKIEPGRKYEKAKYLTSCCINNLDSGFLNVLQDNILYLIEKNKGDQSKIYYLTLETAQKYLNGGNNER
ncbi:MAG: nicotinate-nucleotide adenylyltransferase [Bacilli bacterium]|nr:nicotinate-nucleotide adenylyltransferase [Bacilli bacterium]